MSHSGLLDGPHSNATISPAHHHQVHHHTNSSKMNGSAVQLTHRHAPIPAVSSGILDSSKHSIGTVTGSTATPVHLNSNPNNVTISGPSPLPKIISPKLSHRTTPPLVIPGVNHTLASLGLMCICSLFLALLALIFLLNIEPQKVKRQRIFGSEDSSIVSNLGNYLISTDEFMTVYEVFLCLIMLVIALNLCCLFVCALQFLFAAKLLLASHGVERSCNYLHQSGRNRVIAITAFFLSIPLFFTALILYTFTHFHTTPAMVTSTVIGAAIIFCGLASIYNVYIWQSEKTKVVKSYYSLSRDNSYYPAMLDLTSPNMELSTLV